MYRVHFTSQELDTVLAALRYYQSNNQGDPDYRDDDIHDIATNGGDDISMDSEGIDDLCMKINTTPWEETK